MSRQPLATNAAGNSPGTLSAVPPASPSSTPAHGARATGMRETGTLELDVEAPDAVPATFTILRPASGHERAEQIRDVIDAFRRLRESIDRFNRLFAADASEPPPRGESGASLQPLLAVLARRVDGARFARHRELKRAIRDARRLDKTRDALFSDAFCLDTEAMRQTAAELERLDTAFVRLGVGHVLARHLEDARGAAAETAPAAAAAVEADAVAPMQRDAA
ncbi:hypothetical protein [Paraburkholderia sp. J63]|uniref:hypothetical protein n=1 Tax=Paraburkholderia sp. J63 TaxID=2805434 RepID=UPI002ABD2A12|nr:hypothetical protein [Paraburkholderia sp. J63]